MNIEHEDEELPRRYREKIWGLNVCARVDIFKSLPPY